MQMCLSHAYHTTQFNGYLSPSFPIVPFDDIEHFSFRYGQLILVASLRMRAKEGEQTHMGTDNGVTEYTINFTQC